MFKSCFKAEDVNVSYIHNSYNSVLECYSYKKMDDAIGLGLKVVREP